eukprot:11192810-Heterocapsa_arctica.AAC.1
MLGSNQTIFKGQDSATGKQDVIIIESYNVSGWGSLEKWLERGTEAHIILAQETHLVGDTAVEARSSDRTLGWK